MSAKCHTSSQYDTRTYIWDKPSHELENNHQKSKSEHISFLPDPSGGISKYEATERDSSPEA